MGSPKLAAMRFSRPLTGLILACAASSLVAQGGDWSTFLARWRAGAHAPVTVLAPRAWMASSPWVSDDIMLQLYVGGDLQIQALAGPDLKAVEGARDWNTEPHWLILDRGGEVLDERTGPPDGPTLRGLLLGAGYSPTWEALNHFLQLHPDHGTALAKRLSLASRMASIRFRALGKQGAVEGVRRVPGVRWGQLTPARILDPVRAEGWDREVADTLRRISQLPDAWRLGNDLLFRYWLDFYCAAAGPDLPEGLPALREALLTAWKSYPDSGGRAVLDASSEMGMVGFGGFWMACSRCMPGQADRLPQIPDLEAGPGHVWPDSTLFRELGLAAAVTGRWADLLRMLDRWPESGPSVDASSQAWTEGLAAQLQAAFWRVAALASLHQWPEAAAALQALRELSGSSWEWSRASLKQIYGPSPKPGAEGARPQRDPAPASFLSVLERPPLPDPKLPPPTPLLRFVVWGAPAWSKDWPAIRATGDLAAYAPEELRREEPTPADRARLVAAGLPVQGWTVFRGPTDILARGEGAPDPARLALQLEGSAPSRISLLDTFIRKHPDQLDARKDRYDLVRARMPLPALEARLREDAVAAQLPLDFGPDAPWISDLEAWRVAARRVVPDIQADLERWPDRSYLWRAWVSWSAFLPKPPSVLDFAEALPVFGSRPIWIAGLPAEVHRAVAREGLRARRYQDLLDWFGKAWTVVQARRWEQGITPASRKQEEAIYEGYRDTLRALGRIGDTPGLEKAWAQHEAGYGKAPTR